MMRKLLEVIGGISGVLGIVDIVRNYLKEAEIQISLVGMICLTLCLLSVVLVFLLSNPRRKHDIYKYISYAFHRRNAPYIIKERHAEYNYISRTELENKKTNTIISYIPDLSHFSDSFRWSKPQSVDCFKVNCISDHESISIRRRESWIEYTVEFDPPPKRKERTIAVLIAPLHDPDKEALPYFTTTIREVIQKLKMEVAFSPDVASTNFQYSVYNSNTSRTPIFEETWEPNKKSKYLKYNMSTKTITVEEKYPIYGYRYKLQWDIAD